MKTKDFIRFLKEWALIVSMLAGVTGYFLFASLPLPQPVHSAASRIVATLQPALIFAMLFLTFCKVNVRDLRLRPWHLTLLLIQAGAFTAIGAVLISMPHSGLRIVLEGAMICLICPTATAGAVITGKLGGNVEGITTYTILINLTAALLIPALVPFVHPQPGTDVVTAALLILGKVFPLLLMPLIAAAMVRRFMPAIHGRLLGITGMSFWLWTVALALALAVTTRSIVHSEVDLSTQLWLVAVSLICCVMQFAIGRTIGRRYDDTVTAGQSLGQKNTVLAIWIGYTFFSPITAVAGGFYSIWHNVINSWQLYRHQHHTARQQTATCSENIPTK